MNRTVVIKGIDGTIVEVPLPVVPELIETAPLPPDFEIRLTVGADKTKFDSLYEDLMAKLAATEIPD